MIIKGEDLTLLEDEVGNAFFDWGVNDLYETLYDNIRELNIPDKLIDKYIKERDTKYHLHIIPNDLGYFQQNIDDKDYIVDSLDYNEDYKYEFNTKEIDDLCKEFPQIDFWSCVEEV
jgi:hypothetical protein